MQTHQANELRRFPLLASQILAAMRAVRDSAKTECCKQAQQKALPGDSNGMMLFYDLPRG